MIGCLMHTISFHFVKDLFMNDYFYVHYCGHATQAEPLITPAQQYSQLLTLVNVCLTPGDAGILKVKNQHVHIKLVIYQS